MQCPRCQSTRIQRGYKDAPILSRLGGRQELLCNNCGLEFNGLQSRQMNRTQGAGALPDTVLTYPLRSDWSTWGQTMNPRLQWRCSAIAKRLAASVWLYHSLVPALTQLSLRSSAAICWW